MITLEKVEIFASWNGDNDMFARAGRPTEKRVIDDKDWSLIERMLQDQIVIERNLGSEKRTAKAIENLERHCESNAVVEQIAKLAEKIMRSQKFA